MANLFKNLPHHLGSITNLDAGQSMRALISIKAELQRRQRLFSENEVNHINQYQKLFKDNKVKEPMPHLFLISDEFAELKAEQPEFMKELVSTARIGRSLGIHLILATQKPSGVVDDQIWSNSKFKLCLKVQDEADSREMLKTPDAANITLPGRSYLQVGNNEIYELFQSAWSGANYYKDSSNKHEIDTTIYQINDIGQYEILSEDLSGLEGKETLAQAETELDSIINFLAEYVEQAGIEKLAQPWLPPLAEKFVISHKPFQQQWKDTKDPMVVEIGIIDQPHIQAQNPLELDLTNDGHMILLSSPGFGKSTTLQTLAMQLARAYRPDQLHMYLLDYGTNGLLALKNLPHVADTIGIDDVEKVEKLARILIKEMKARKDLLSQYSVANLEYYERASGKTLPNIVIFIDNYDAVKDAEFSESIISLTTQISREGASVGVHLVMSANNLSAFRSGIQSNVKIKLAQFLNDKMEVTSAVGRSEFTIEETAGRGLIKLDQPTMFQIGLPAHGENVLEIIEAIQKESQAMTETFTGTKPKPIPMVPEVLTYAEFINMDSVQTLATNKQFIPFSVDFENVEAVSWNVFEGNILFATSQMKDNIIRIKSLFQQMQNKSFKQVILDIATHDLEVFQDEVISYTSDAEQHETIIAELHEAIVLRTEEYKQYKQQNPTAKSAEHFFANDRTIVYINQPVNIFDTLNSSGKKQLMELLASDGKMGISIVLTTDIHSMTKGYDDMSKFLKTVGQVVLETKITDQNAFTPANKTYKEPMLAYMDGYFIQNNFAYKVKLIEVQ